jgi:hypothetical protein
MAGVPYTFSTASQSIPLAQLDSNFATPVTLGTSTAALGQTVTTLNNITLSNVTITSGNISNVTLGNSGVSAGIYGNSSYTAEIVVNSQGLVTGAANVAIGILASQILTPIPNSGLGNSSVTLGNTTVNLGNSSSSIGNLTLNNVMINSGNLSNALIPTANGTVMLSGNMPAFSYYLGTNQTISTATFTKVQINTKEFDTANAFDAATNYRFQPTVAGYYQINGEVTTSATTQLRLIAFIYKNGTNYKSGNDVAVPAGGVTSRSVVSSLVYLNGSTDYVELYGYLVGTGTLTFTGGAVYDCYFNGSLVRGS